MIRLAVRVVLPLLAVLALSGAAVAAEPGSLQEIYDAAGEAFWNGDYQAAVEGYQRLEELGVREPAVSFNLGTAYARQGKLGRAVQHYERAQRAAEQAEWARTNPEARARAEATVTQLQASIAGLEKDAAAARAAASAPWRPTWACPRCALRTKCS